MSKPTNDEIEDKIAEAEYSIPTFNGLTYEEGIAAALRWVLGEGSDPMED